MKRTLFLVALFAASSPAQARPIDFNRDIRPLLSDACFHCHGPDVSQRKAKLRLDTADSYAERDEGHAIVPGKPEKSLVLQRILSADPELRMPPANSTTPLKQEQVELLRRWIAEGAKYQKHWAFLPPTRSALPAVKDKAWPKNGVDHFVLERLERDGLKPSPAADRVTLIRRVSLDLTGLPATPAEIDAFVNDSSADAFEKVVDRLLKSPRYGERMAQRWLDAARYADTNGYQNDGPRTMHRWRDWVIEAYNANMPFDQFTIEQLAGDLLPEATLDQKIATGFNRNHRLNSEGGVIPEEYAAEYVVDRVDTTSTVWLGLTMGCARCHDHKYDPLTQKEFYQLFAYFNNVPERGKAIKYGNSPPVVKAPTKEQAKRLAEFQRDVKEAEAALAKVDPRIAKLQSEWESQKSTVDEHWTPARRLHHLTTFDDLFVKGKPTYSREDGGNVEDVAGFSFFERFSIAVRLRAENAEAGPILSKVEDNDRAAGYQLLIKDGKIHLHFAKRWLDDAIRVETVGTVELRKWQHVMFTYDASRLASGIKLYVNGKAEPLKVNLDDLNQDITTKEPFRVGADPTQNFNGQIEDVLIFRGVITPEEVAALALDGIGNIRSRIPENRTPAESYKLRWYFLEKHAPEDVKALVARVTVTRDALQKFDDAIPTSMVMQEMTPPRPAHILLRGEYDKLGARVERGVPAVLDASAKRIPDRLAFAKWLVQPGHPLTARVAVNRHWQMLFGTGIVKSVEDFGAQGEWPSHPELLDWLALNFEKDWDIRRLLKTIVMSATYQQSSKLQPTLLQRDPENRLLARGPRLRLSAEMIRDQALFVSGLLVEKIGGPSVRPYQPAGLAKELHGLDEDGHDKGENLYRRGMYTFWKRTVAPPSMTTFDAANRETCVVRESRTNTPLQALNLLNDVTFVEAARNLAQRAMKNQDPIGTMFRSTTGRVPTKLERGILISGFTRHLHHYQKHREAAIKLLAMGESPHNRNLDVSQLAAYTALANTLFNLDEVITKE